MVQKRAEKNVLARVLSFLIWLTGVIVSLAVAFGMIDGTLYIKFIPQGVTLFFGWVVVVTTLIGVIIAIAHYIRGN